MSSNENEINVNSKKDFFGNSEVPYCLKDSSVLQILQTQQTPSKVRYVV